MTHGRMTHGRTTDASLMHYSQPARSAAPRPRRWEARGSGRALVATGSHARHALASCRARLVATFPFTAPPTLTLTPCHQTPASSASCCAPPASRVRPRRGAARARARALAARLARPAPPDPPPHQARRAPTPLITSLLTHAAVIHQTQICRSLPCGRQGGAPGRADPPQPRRRRGGGRRACRRRGAGRRAGRRAGGGARAGLGARPRQRALRGAGGARSPAGASGRCLKDPGSCCATMLSASVHRAPFSKEFLPQSGRQRVPPPAPGAGVFAGVFRGRRRGPRARGSRRHPN